MEILFLSHCVPAPPDKGERIRCWNELNYLAKRHRVHLACFARDAAEIEAAHSLQSLCESVYVEPLGSCGPFARAWAGFAAGRSLSHGWYESPGLRRHVQWLRTRPLAAAFVYTVPMARYAPPGLPVVLDMADVDSEKWYDYAKTRAPAFLYRAEAPRFRSLELRALDAASRVLLTTAAELSLLRSFAPAGNAFAVENGVDFEYFDPSAVPAHPHSRPYLLFAGSMDYYPNVEAAARFAREILPALRARRNIGFVIAGRNPSRSVRKLAGIPGVAVTGTVPDIRPYFAGALATVAPLRIARGVQNKVLEALAMDRPVLASEAVCDTFGRELPPGLLRCARLPGWVEALCTAEALRPGLIRESARRRFSWETQMSGLAAHIEAACSPGIAHVGTLK